MQFLKQVISTSFLQLLSSHWSILDIYQMTSEVNPHLPLPLRLKGFPQHRAWHHSLHIISSLKILTFDELPLQKTVLNPDQTKKIKCEFSEQAELPGRLQIRY